MSVNILLIHGPNLNLLGKREPEIYGSQTLEDINSNLIDIAEKHVLEQSEGKAVELKFFQSNSEGEIVTFIGENMGWADGIIINPAAYTHTSVAIRDALSAVELPVIEVHLSNIYQREEFRHFSYISPVVLGVISGFGAHSYELALHAMIRSIMP